MFRRAAGFCEYCLIHEEDTFFGCELDHVVSRKHHGPSDAANLALACLICNRRKGSDVGSLDQRTGRYVRLYHPRRDRWLAHFFLRDGASEIRPRTDVGVVTERLLDLDSAARRSERRALAALGRYPPPRALLRRFGAGLNDG